MFEPFAPVINAFARELGRNYRAMFGKSDPDHAPVLRATARLALERIAGSDALYHDALHTLFVTDVGQAILRGRAMVAVVSPRDWLHFTAATLLHDIGYLRGICPGAMSSTRPGQACRHPAGPRTPFSLPGTLSAVRSLSATAAPGCLSLTSSGSAERSS